MPSTTSWNDSSIFSRQVISAASGLQSLCSSVSVMSCVVHPSMSLTVLHQIMEKGNSFWEPPPCFPTVSSAAAQGRSISAIGHSATEEAGRVSCSRSFKSLHSQWCCKCSFSVLHSAASTGWEKAPQPCAQQGFVDSYLQQKAVICFSNQPQISMVTS